MLGPALKGVGSRVSFVGCEGHFGLDALSVRSDVISSIKILSSRVGCRGQGLPQSGRGGSTGVEKFDL